MTPEVVQELCRLDQKLAKLIGQVGPCLLKAERGESPFEALTQSVAYQQLSGKAAATIFGRVKALYPKKKFPSPEDILATPDQTLRGAGLSGSKVAAIKDIALKAKEGLVPTAQEAKKLSDQELIDRLTLIRGVGQWTVEMLLIFNLGRPDVLPVTDYGVRKGFAKTFRKKELPTPQELMKYGIKWKPYRTTASWYLWRALDSIPE